MFGAVRVSFGSWSVRATLARVRCIAEELCESGSHASLTQNDFSRADANRMFEG